MTPRERWLAVLERKRPDRVPMDYWATGEANERLVKHLGCKDLEEAFGILHIDTPLGVGPKYIGPKPPEGEDIYGCRFKDVQYGTGVYTEIVYNPLAQYETLEEVKRSYEWPDPDWWDYSGIPGQVKGEDDRPNRGVGPSRSSSTRAFAASGKAMLISSGTRISSITAWTSSSTWPTRTPEGSMSRSRAG